ncbi:hypothetical protein BN1723_003474 [Verticillium longisporum]|uniref:Uncharacterized protein n=1 Tax=Verticillium longisporum TaxID=100787 RepID=A0A0G4LZ10_VERLO|nr:hypothetical protein BN1723_003474 [Verticillium longisporum]
MTFTPIDPPRCAHYAQFASHLERWQFDLVYWALFIFNLFILFGAAYGYSRTLEKIEELPEGSPKRKPLVPIVICRKDGFQLIYNGELQKGQKQNESSSQGTASKHG